MNPAPQQFNTTLSLAEVEALIRRAVRDAVHKEFARFLRQASPSIADDWSHEGEDDLAGDRILQAEALTERDRYRTNPEEWLDWDAFKSELRAVQC